MSEIPKAYEPQAVEEKWYQFWLDHSCFTADPARVSAKRPAYSIVIPPPNVTGMLHMGHVLNNTIQDILARKARMDGKEVLWLPGTDHAGISTEGMVSKQIWQEEKKSKREIGREEFIKRVWLWKEKHGSIIISQLKKLGCSCDWTRERFTMDEPYVRCVRKVFVELYKKGLIYRGKRMVNWCPATQTALSDEEVEMESQKGFLYYFKVQVVETDGAPVRVTGVPLTPTLPPSGGEGGDRVARHTSDSLSPNGGEGQGEGATKAGGPIIDAEGRVWLTIATTRPETIPGDTAIAVNAKDPRYAQFIGKHAIRPLPAELPLEKKLIPIIGDEYVDFEFGTGVLKVTPAHDKNDFEIGQRHKLAAVDIMNPNGSMNDLAGKDLAGLDRFEARKIAVEKLRELGVLEKQEPYENKIGFSQRARVPIEPRLSEQWFLKYPAVEPAKACVEQEERGAPAPREVEAETRGAGAPRSEKMQFHPQRWAKVYDHWLTNIQDWCISRQLWWGHRIPVWYKKSEIRNPKSEIERAEIWCDIKSPPDSEGWEQDPDVLDTWFSSWLWPFATMGWTGDQSQDSNNPTLRAFYPTTDLVTGPDIIFFWVARMIMAGYEFMGDLPFRNVYFTGIIRDKQGRKMSKTLGNSPDPLELIAKYGADALRFGTMRSAPLGQDVLFDEKDVELGRNFCNKLWNACRFRQMQSAAGILPADQTPKENQNFRQDAGSTLQPAADVSSAGQKSASQQISGERLGSAFEVQGEINPSLLTNDDKWILLKLNQAIKEITEAFTEYKFNEATATLYRFFWSEYCDWYVEASKATLTKNSSEGVTSLQSYKVTSDPNVTMQPCNPVTSSAARRANTLAVIDFVLSHTLRLFHPFLPFVTEELWHGMGYAEDMPEDQGGQTIMNAPWPKPFDGVFRDHYALDDCYLEFAQAKYDLVTEGRNLRRIGNIPGGKKVKFIFKPVNSVRPHDAEVIRILLNAESLEIVEDYQPKKGTPTAHTPLGELFLPLEGLLDVEAEKARLKKELEKAEAEIAKVEQKLSNPAFTSKAPLQVLRDHEQRLAEWQAKRDHAKSALDALEG